MLTEKTRGPFPKRPAVSCEEFRKHLHVIAFTHSREAIRLEAQGYAGMNACSTQS